MSFAVFFLKFFKKTINLLHKTVNFGRFLALFVCVFVSELKFISPNISVLRKNHFFLRKNSEYIKKRLCLCSNILAPLPVRTARSGRVFYFYLYMDKIIYDKSFLSIEAQIKLLKSRGMKFLDENKALHLLENISYYRFSGY